MPIVENPYLALIVVFPLAGALINGALHLIACKKNVRLKTISAGVAIAASLLSFIAVLSTCYTYTAHHADIILKQSLWNWIVAEPLFISLSLQFDSLTAVMLLFVTFVATLIHIYSVAYMADDENFIKYFSYLNLFLFSMELLVLGDNLAVLFIGWEGVGLCSYLLIAFWYADEEKANAGKKAFIANRIGDAGFLIGIFLLLHAAGTLTFSDLMHKQEVLVLSATAIGISLFIGATGKSAQIPLYVWLPDAMAGPTPVSALIHAATMVTAGVYMVVRMNFLFQLSPVVSTVIAITGAATALFAAIIALRQNDIKKILAYSTISQLGYMFLGAGVGAYAAGIFHVMTHAFFKALLFLGAGAIIHALHQQDIRAMGGLRKKMPITAYTFMIAWLAICGIPPFSGFFSKDEILWNALSQENIIMPHLPVVLYISAMITVFLTAVYMTRLVAMTFFGEGKAGYIRHDQHVEYTEHPAMYIPLMILALCSAFAGFAGVPHVLGGGNHIEHFLTSVLSMQEGARVSPEMKLPLMGISILVALCGIAFSLYIFLWRTAPSQRRAAGFVRMKRIIENKFFIDEIYEAMVLKPLRTFADRISFRIIDASLIEGFVHSLGPFVYFWSKRLSRMHTGNIQHYVLYIFLGMSVLVYLMLVQL